MDPGWPILLGFTVAAGLYASVGHAGASGYLAVMALAGMAPEQMKPVALLLNVVVASIALVQFARAGCFSWRLFWPFALGAIPFAVLGGALQVPAGAYRVLIGVGLLLSAMRLAWPTSQDPVPAVPRWWIALPLGAGIGLLAGLTGTGGGIYLSPLLILCRWGAGRDTGGVAAAFILANSLAGLIGHRPVFADLPPALPWWALAVAVAGFAGSWLGSRCRTPGPFKRLLAVVLAIAAAKLLFT